MTYFNVYAWIISYGIEIFKPHNFYYYVRVCNVDEQPLEYNLYNYFYSFKMLDIQIHQYKTLRRKLYSCNARIYFNQECPWNNVTPNHAKIKIPKTSPVSKYAQNPFLND
jgi:hypothetical protein